tara:strand:+ start:1441 stop:1710 length:270 start_codon:yes stop_codon:yes gene_type:complete
MNEEIKIEKNVPILNPRTGTGLCIAVRNAISEMEVGDSFIVPESWTSSRQSDKSKRAVNALVYKEFRDRGWASTCRINENNKFRCWRTK